MRSGLGRIIGEFKISVNYHHELLNNMDFPNENIDWLHMSPKTSDANFVLKVFYFVSAVIRNSNCNRNSYGQSLPIFVKVPFPFHCPMFD